MWLVWLALLPMLWLLSSLFTRSRVGTLPLLRTDLSIWSYYVLWSHYDRIKATLYYGHYDHLMVPRVELGWSFSREPSTSLSRSRFSMLEPLGRPWK